MDEIKSKVGEECLRQQQQAHVKVEVHKAPEQALATSRNTGRGQCFACGEHGHYIRDCQRKRNNGPKQLYGNGDNRRERYGESANRFGGRRQDHQPSNGEGRKPKDAYYASAMSASINSEGSTDRWIIDSGSTTHICNRNMLHPHHEENKQADGSITVCKWIGTVELETDQRIIVIHEVLFVPDYKMNLSSVNRAEYRSYKVSFENGEVRIENCGIVIAKGVRVNDQYCLDLIANRRHSEVLNVNASGQSLPIMEWDRRLGHLKTDCILKMNRDNTVKGMEITPSQKESCEVCARCKLTEGPFPRKSTNRAKFALERIHSVVCEMPQRSYGGAKYMVTFIDDHSRFVKVECLNAKSEVFYAWTRFKANVERQTGQ